MKDFSIICLSTYPPRECGIATFARDFLESIKTIYPQVNIKVIALNKKNVNSTEYSKEVSWQIDQDDKDSFIKIAKKINKEKKSFVVIQHEYGIYGGNDGENLLEFMRHCKKNMCTVFHTVLPHPSDSMKKITQEIIDRSSLIQVFTKDSQKILRKNYKIRPKQIFVVPHGIHPVVFQKPEKFKEKFNILDHKVISTFGMLSRGKGIEYVIDALPQVVEKHPNILYLIIGVTHPVVKKEEGESYRLELEKKVRELNLENNVRFINQYLPTEEILSYLQATDIYISTSLSPDQAVSGTFSYAIGSGRAIVSTDFRQAKNIITPSIGRIIPVRDSQAYADNIIELLDHPDKLPSMHKKAYRSSRGMLWTNIAYQYLDNFSKFFPNWTFFPDISLDYLKKMTDKNGLIQFAKFSSPQIDSGYTLDDNARAIIACIKIGKRRKKMRPELKKIIEKYLKIIDLCKVKDGFYINYLDKNLSPTSQNEKEDLQDCLGRTIWCFGKIFSCPWLDKKIKEKYQKELMSLIKNRKEFNHLRAISFAILGLAAYFNNSSKNFSKNPELFSVFKIFSKKLINSYDKFSHDNWLWFESELKYSNAFLSLAFLKAGKLLSNQNYKKIALNTLEFLAKKCFFDVVYVPVGQNSWYVKGKKRSVFDQQPEDPSGSVLAFIEAYRQTKNKKWFQLSKKTFSWFLGNNLLGKRLYNDNNASCHDGLNKTGINLNQGAESLVSYLISRSAISEK